MDADVVDCLKTRLAATPDVRLAYLFGSRATDRADATSDVDVAVLFDRGTPHTRSLELGADLEVGLGLGLDLVSLNHAPIELAMRVVIDGRAILARSEFERVEYEATILARASDLAPLLAEQRRDILEGGSHDRAVERYRAAFGAPGRLPRQA